MRRKIMELSSTLFISLFTKGVHRGYEVILDGLPDDTIIIDVEVNHFNNTEGHASVKFLVESQEFDEVEAGDRYPQIMTTCKYIS